MASEEVTIAVTSTEQPPLVPKPPAFQIGLNVLLIIIALGLLILIMALIAIKRRVNMRRSRICKPVSNPIGQGLPKAFKEEILRRISKNMKMKREPNVLEAYLQTDDERINEVLKKSTFLPRLKVIDEHQKLKKLILSYDPNMRMSADNPYAWGPFLKSNQLPIVKNKDHIQRYAKLYNLARYDIDPFPEASYEEFKSINELFMAEIEEKKARKFEIEQNSVPIREGRMGKKVPSKVWKSSTIDETNAASSSQCMPSTSYGTRQRPKAGMKTDQEGKNIELIPLVTIKKPQEKMGVVVKRSALAASSSLPQPQEATIELSEDPLIASTVVRRSSVAGSASGSVKKLTFPAATASSNPSTVTQGLISHFNIGNDIIAEDPDYQSLVVQPRKRASSSTSSTGSQAALLMHNPKEKAANHS